MSAAAPGEGITYEPDEKCSIALSLGMGIQGVVLALAPTVLGMSLFVQAANLSQRQATWAVVAAILVCGMTSVLSAARLGPVGGGHNLLIISSTAFLAVSILAVNRAGPQTFASLVVASALCHIVLARWLHRLSRIITPVVSGVVLMLIAIGVMQVAVDRLDGSSEGVTAAAEPAVALITILSAAAVAMRARGRLRLWSPVLAVIVACVIAALFGLFDLEGVRDAAWIALPRPDMPGLDLTPGVDFWTLLPMFLVVSLASVIKTMTTSVVLQRVSWRQPTTPDYRLVRGTVNAIGVGSLAGGLAGTLPVGTMDATSISFASLTGVAARRVGYSIGAIFVALAMLPKFVAALLSIPHAVTSGYLIFFMGLLFVEGLRLVFQDGIAPQKAVIVGVSIGIGASLHGNNLMESIIGGAWGALLGNGMILGTLTALLLTAYIELSSRKRSRLEAELKAEALREVDGFLSEVAASVGWNEASANRLRLVGEESLLSLIEASEEESQPRLVVIAQPAPAKIELELRASLDAENLEDRLTFLSERSEASHEGAFSLRLLSHFASTVRHRQYSGIDIITVEVERR
ncbi:uracil-xanthine permease family protein [Candidatus Poriferisodalis sp.]|uniref:uracil-xanthine permease family protein n=1 Tax=Candidatus Poriferisodalis sp. TaxID=3101277 RepID=UPI003B5C348A